MPTFGGQYAAERGHYLVMCWCHWPLPTTCRPRSFSTIFLRPFPPPLFLCWSGHYPRARMDLMAEIGLLSSFISLRDGSVPTSDSWWPIWLLFRNSEGFWGRFLACNFENPSQNPYKPTIQACAEKRDCFAKHQPGVAGCGWLKLGRDLLST